MDKQTLILVRDASPIEDLVLNALNEYFNLVVFPLLAHSIRQIEKGNAELILISDNHANSFTGIELLKKIKKKFHKSLIIYQANTPKQEFIVNAFQSGASDFILGPLCLNKLQSSLNRLRELYPISTSIPSKKKDIRALYHINAGINALKKRVVNKWFSPEHIPVHNVLYSFPILEKQVLAEQINHHHVKEDSLKVRLFGEYRVSLNGKSVDKLLNKKSKIILAYLLFYNKKRISSEHLIEVFWPNITPESAKNNLHVAIHSIRKAFHKKDASRSFIIFSDDNYYINPAIEFNSDVCSFLDHWKKGRLAEHQDDSTTMILNYSQAATYYSGDLIEGHLCEAWTQEERDNLREIFLVVLERLSEYYESLNSWDEVENYCKQILEKDNCRELIHRRLMRCYYHQGYRGRALKQFYTCKKVLKEELEADPGHSTIDLYKQIKRDTPKF